MPALSLEPRGGQPWVHPCGPACSFWTRSPGPAAQKAAPLTCVPCSRLGPPPAPATLDPRIATASRLHTLPPAPPTPICAASRPADARSRPRDAWAADSLSAPHLPGPLPPCQASCPRSAPLPVLRLCAQAPPERSGHGGLGRVRVVRAAETVDDPAEPGSREAAWGHR